MSQCNVFFGLLLSTLFFSACGVHPVDPGGFTGNMGGCGNFFVYKFNTDMTEAVAISAQASDITFDQTPREFTLPHPAFNVTIARFSGPALLHYCDDVIEEGEPEQIHTWNVVSGTITVATGDTLSNDPFSTTYEVFVSLRDATFQDDEGDEVRIDLLDYGKVVIGWLPG